MIAGSPPFVQEGERMTGVYKGFHQAEIWCLILIREIHALFVLMFAAVHGNEGKAIHAQEKMHSSLVNEQAKHVLSMYGNHILRLAYSYLHNMSDAEDVLQDTLIQYIKTQPQFDSAEHEKAWFLRVAMNISKNKIKYNSIRKTDDLYEELVAGDNEDLAFVWEAVKQLPSKYREVVHLYYHEGYATAQIASLLSTKEPTVRSLLLRARAQLKLVLQEVYDFGEQV